MKNGTCLRYSLNNLREVVGNFQNGSLTGNAKLTFKNGEKIIVGLKNGVFYGLFRQWDANGVLNLVNFYNQFIISHSWKRIGNFLIFTNEARIKPSKVKELDFVVDLNTKKSYVGFNNQVFLLLENVLEAEMVGFEQTDSCLPKPEWIAKKRLDFTLNLLNGQELRSETTGFCPSFTKGSNVEQDFESFRNVIKPTNQTYFKLWQMRPIETSLDLSKVKTEFISNVTLVDFKQNQQIFNMSVFNGEPMNFVLETGSLDENMNFHGYCNLIANVTFEWQRKRIGKHPFLKWQPMEIRGHFVNGRLHGPAFIRTVKSNDILATFKNGVIHGPILATGLTLIMHEEYLVSRMNNLSWIVL